MVISKTAISNAPLTSRPLTSRLYWGVLVLALVARLGVFALVDDPLGTDPDGYRSLAAKLMRTGVFGSRNRPTAYRPPLYPLLLAPCMAIGGDSVWPILALHLELGMATVAGTIWLGRAWGLGRGAALAGLIVAVDPILLSQSTRIMTETLAAALAVATLVGITWAARRPSPWMAVAPGICLGLAALCRPTFLAWGVLIAVSLTRLASNWSARGKLVLSFALGVGAILAPWAIRNQIAFGRPIFTTTHGGYTLLLANNPGFYKYLKSPSQTVVWHADDFDARVAKNREENPGTEIEHNEREYEEAKRNIARDPDVFVWSCFVRTGRFWSPLPHRLSADESTVQRLQRYAVCAWYLFWVVIVLLGVWENGALCWRHPWVWGFLLVLGYSAPHAIYWSDMRMRAPLGPFLALLGARGLSPIGIWFTRRKSLPNRRLRRTDRR